MTEIPDNLPNRLAFAAGARWADAQHPAPTKAEQDAVFQRLMDLGRGFQPDLYDVAGEVVVMLQEAVAEVASKLDQAGYDEAAHAIRNRNLGLTLVGGN